MSVEKTVEGVVAIFIIIVFITTIFPALFSVTKTNIFLVISITLSLFLLLVGIIFTIIKSWAD